MEGGVVVFEISGVVKMERNWFIGCTCVVV